MDLIISISFFFRRVPLRSSLNLANGEKLDMTNNYSGKEFDEKFECYSFLKKKLSPHVIFRQMKA